MDQIGYNAIDVHLTGKETIVENNTSLDPSKQKDLQLLKTKLVKTQGSVQQLIKKGQMQYKTDIFGFDEHVHQPSRT